MHILSVFKCKKSCHLKRAIVWISQLFSMFLKRLYHEYKAQLHHIIEHDSAKPTCPNILEMKQIQIKNELHNSYFVYCSLSHKQVGGMG